MCNYIYKELSCQHHYHLVESWCPKYIETERRCPPTIVSKQYWGDDICGKEFGSLGANPFFWPMWDGGHFVPLLTRKRRLQAWQKLWYLFGGGWRPIDSPGPALEESPKAGGMGGTEDSAQTPAMCIFSPPTGESLGHHSSAYSTVGSMPRTGQALSPINSDLISTLDATPPASGATPMIICMRGLMTVIRAAYYQATPLGLISREKKKKQPNHIWHGKES
ncbi:hypothetical protein FGLOB1_2764 [Fusarium globosum]|uniref:Uncharacterized protein n=1 Tax=Fusarium globosum TaxID=78864 RepID=A0A8H5YNQ9_9HYPO|nr:hypothetical protein FGLOB1_2764 [Fusarium globosum]